jgi:hypothetical protein
MNKKGFGVEDSPFMILATVAVMMFVAWIGIETMAGFIAGNEHQSAVEASTDIYKRAKLLSIGYEGSSDELMVTVPEGYVVLIDDTIVSLGDLHYENGTLTNSTELSEPLSIKGIPLVSKESLLPAGNHIVNMTYKDGEIRISWE